MAEPGARERLQPALLDRLRDDDPLSDSESPNARVIDITRLKAAVLRDLTWLFNSVRAEPSPGGLAADEAALWAECPEARRSVLNYGLPALSGRSFGRGDLREIEQAVREAIAVFEPRIDPAALSVAASGGRSGSTLRFRIRGEMWSQPVAQEIVLRSELDVETGNATVREDR